MICAYIIRHPFTGAFYIGSTDNFIRRRSQHLSYLRRGLHVNGLFQYAFNMSRELTWETIEKEALEEARLLENQLILKYKDDPKITNQIGVSGHTEETKKQDLSG